MADSNSTVMATPAPSTGPHIPAAAAAASAAATAAGPTPPSQKPLISPEGGLAQKIIKIIIKYFYLGETVSGWPASTW